LEYKLERCGLGKFHLLDGALLKTDLEYRLSKKGSLFAMEKFKNLKV